MRCQYCNCTDSKVIDSRPTEEGNSIRRRRECTSCGRRFTTYEKIELLPLMVVKRDGRRQTFERAKLHKAIQQACGKRKISDEQIRSIIDRVVANIEGDEVSSATIAELVMTELHKVDEVAYIRFARVYRQFKDVSQFLSAITEIVRK